MYVESYKELIVWQRAMALAKEIYRKTEALPKSELYGLTSQMRRSAVSISSNIAEGHKRKGLGEYVYFLSVADASAAELETQILLVCGIYPDMSLKRSLALLEEVQKMLTVMIKKLKAKSAHP
jgi:four helix bundle protein